MNKGPIGHFLANKDLLWKTPAYYMKQAHLRGENMTLGQGWGKAIKDYVTGNHILELRDPTGGEMFDLGLSTARRSARTGQPGRIGLYGVTQTVDSGKVWASRRKWGLAVLGAGAANATFQGTSTYSREMESYGGTSLIGSPSITPDPQMALDSYDGRSAY
jgi:hypothetical protein